MKKLLRILQVTALLMCLTTVGKAATIYQQDGQVHYLLPETTNKTINVTPFVACPYRFSSPDRIAHLFFDDSFDLLETIENNEYVFYIGDEETLTVSKADQYASLHFDSKYSETVFTPIPFVQDIYALRSAVRNWDQDLSFMGRAEAELQAECFVNEIYEGLNFKSIATFAITREEYNSQYNLRRDELEVWFADPKMSEGMRRWIDFPQEDLGYLICLVQEINELPISWSFFQNVRGAPYARNVEIWVFWTPEGCKYLSADYQVMDPKENTGECEVLTREQAMTAFSEAYNYTLGAKEIEVWDMQLVWFADMSGNDSVDANLTFRPMWCIYVPKFYSEDETQWGEFGYWVDAFTGETWT